MRSFAFLLCAMFFVSLPGALFAQASNHGHWKFEETSGTTAADSSAQGRNATLSGGAGFGAGLVDTNGLVLDGVDGVAVVDDSASFEFQNSFTWSAWIRSDADADTPNGIIIAENREDFYPGRKYMHLGTERNPDPTADPPRPNNGFVRAIIGDLGGLNSVLEVNDGDPHHVALVMDMQFICEKLPFPQPHQGGTGVVFLEKNRIETGNYSIYIDGVIDNPGDPTCSEGGGTNYFRLRPAPGDVSIGGPSGAPTPDNFPAPTPENPDPPENHNYFNGVIDDVRFYDGPLSDDEITAVFESDMAAPIACPADSNATVTGITVAKAAESPDVVVSATTYLATATGGDDPDGDTLWYMYTAEEQNTGARVVRGPKKDDTKTFEVEVPGATPEDPPVLVERTDTRTGAEHNLDLWEGDWIVTVQVTDNLLCPDAGGARTVSSDQFTIEPLVATPAGGCRVSELDGGVQIWWEGEDWGSREPEAAGDLGWRRETYTPGNSSFQGGEYGGAFGGYMSPAPNPANDPPNAGSQQGQLLRYFPDISLAGGGAGVWYLWGRTINPFNTSDHCVARDDPNDLDADIDSFDPDTGLFTGGGRGNDDRIFEEDSSPFWCWQRLQGPGRDRWEGHELNLQDGGNELVFARRQGGNTTKYDVLMLTDDPLFVPEDSDYQGSTVKQPFVPGDFNLDGGVDISDPVADLNFQFAGIPAEDCLVAGVGLNATGVQLADFNGDGGHDISDPVASLNWQFAGAGNPPHVLGQNCRLLTAVEVCPESCTP